MDTAREQPAMTKIPMLIAMFVGLLQGFTGWAANHCWTENLAEQIPWLALFDAVLVGGLCLQLLLKRQLALRECLMATATGLLFGATTWWSLQQMDTHNQNDEGFFSLYLFLFLLAYVLIP